MTAAPCKGPDLRVRDAVILANAVDAADKALLPATFAALSVQLSLGPSQLGLLSLAQSISFSLALPVWGALVQNVSHRDLMVWGCVSFGVVTLIIAGASSFAAHLGLRLLVGGALAAVVPVSQAIICDVVPQAEQGWAFGLMQSVAALCAMITTSATAFVAQRTYYGIHGWRLALCLVALLAFVAAAWVWRVVPRREPEHKGQSLEAWWSDQRRVLGRVAVKPSLFYMVAQGVVGSIPWNAFAFLPFFFHLRGYSDLETSQILFWGGLGALAGGVLGGCLGDRAARVTPYAGRLVVAQASVALGMVAFVWLMYMPFDGARTAVLCGASLLTFNAVAGWTNAAALMPIVGQIVPSAHERAQMLALLYALSGIVASICGAPVVGWLSELFGFRLDQSHVGGHSASLHAMRNALVAVSIIPWALCWLAWLPLYRTYPADHAEALQQEAGYGAAGRAPNRAGG